MSTIVVTTDLSDVAAKALPAAKQLADAMQLPLVLLHVVHVPELAPAFTGSPELDRDAAQSELEKLARGLGGNVRTRVAEADEVVAGITREARAAGAELLVVASNGRSGLQRLRLGSVAEQLLEASDVPVVCVPSRGDSERAAGRIVVASDLSETAAHAFPVARRLAQALDLPMTLLVVDDPTGSRDTSQVEAHAAQLRGDEPATVTTEVVSAPDPAQGIIEHAQLQDAAFVCTAAAPKSALRRLLLGSVSREVMRAASFPVVVVPASG